MEPQNQMAPAQPARPKERNIKKTLFNLLVALVLLAAGAAAGWWYRDSQAKDELAKKDTELTSLQTKNAKLTKDLADAKKADTADATASKTPDAETLDNIKASITSGNTAALEGYMAPSVRVIIAATEGVGDRTPAQAVSDLKYIDAATDPWDFALATATLNKYQTGDYKQYFPTTALVGLSANKYLISFQFDSSAKINGIFLTNNADSL